jgi:AraC-like DNA-binding protein
MPLLKSGGYHGFDRAIYSQKRVTEAFHITYIAAKKASWKIADADLEIHAGEIGIIQPGAYHCGRWNHDLPNTHFWFYFNPDAHDAKRHTPFSNDYLMQCRNILAASGQRAIPVRPIYGQLCDLIFEELMQPEKARNYFLIRCIICQLFVLTIESLQSSEQGKVNAMELLIQEIKRDLLQWENVKDMAKAFDMDTERFQRFFRREFGLSPWDYVIRARCERACEELITSRKRVTDIAYDFGFSSSQHFSTVFRNMIGLTPSKFRGKYQLRL